MPGGSANAGGGPVSPDKVLGQVYGEVPVEVVGRGGGTIFFFVPHPPPKVRAGRSKSILTIPEPASPADRTDPADWAQPIGDVAHSRLAGQKGSKSVKSYQKNKNYYNRKVIVIFNPRYFAELHQCIQEAYLLEIFILHFYLLYMLNQEKTKIMKPKWHTTCILFQWNFRVMSSHVADIHAGSFLLNTNHGAGIVIVRLLHPLRVYSTRIWRFIRLYMCHTTLLYNQAMGKSHHSCERDTYP